MNEDRVLIENYRQDVQNRGCPVLATVTRIEGSSYRRAGARMLITSTGSLWGSVSGGCLERELVKKAGLVRANAKPMLVQYDTNEDADPSPSAALGCNGIIDIWLEPLRTDGFHPALHHIESLQKSRARGQILLITGVLSNPKELQVHEGDYILTNKEGGLAFSTIEDPELLNPILKKLLKEKSYENIRQAGSKEFSVGDLTVRGLIENYVPPISWTVFGAGYDAIAMTRLSSELGWDVTLVDTRSAIAVPRTAFPAEVRYIQSNPSEISSHLSLRGEDCAILMTHNGDHDLKILPELLRHELSYVGILGPKKRGETLLRELASRNMHFSAQALANVHSPVGLDIGATDPQTIALSALSEVLTHLNKKSARSLRDLPGPIYPRELF